MIEFKKGDVTLNTNSMKDLVEKFNEHPMDAVNKRTVTITVTIDGEKYDATGTARKGASHVELYFTNVERQHAPKNAFDTYLFLHVRDLNHRFAIHQTGAFLNMFNSGEYVIS